MPEQKQLKIERYDVIQVESATKNQYGDLIINDGIKIGNKRSHLFDVFQPGAEVKVGYAVYMNKEYIATAEQTGKHSAEATKPDHLVKEAIKMGAEVTSTINTKDRAVSISYAKDLVVAGKIELKDISKYANKFLDYILNIKRKED